MKYLPYFQCKEKDILNIKTRILDDFPLSISFLDNIKQLESIKLSMELFNI